jgi:hypothetical protein
LLLIPTRCRPVDSNVFLAFFQRVSTDNNVGLELIVATDINVGHRRLVSSNAAGFTSGLMLLVFTLVRFRTSSLIFTRASSATPPCPPRAYVFLIFCPLPYPFPPNPPFAGPQQATPADEPVGLTVRASIWVYTAAVNVES